MSGSGKQLTRFINRDGGVHWRMHHQQRLFQIAQLIGHRSAANVVEELRSDGELPATQRNLRVSGIFDISNAGGKLFCYMLGAGRSADSHHCASFGYGACGADYCSTAETVANQNLRSGVRFAQHIRGRDQVCHVAAEVGIREVAVGSTESGKVETQYRHAVANQSPGNTAGCSAVFAAGETVGQRERTRQALDPVAPEPPQAAGPAD